MLDVYLASIGALALLAGLASRRLRYLPVSEPLMALALGVLIGPAVFGLVEIPLTERDGVLATAARLTLALSLMSVGLRYSLDEVRRHVPAVALLVTVVMVGMAAVSAGLAWLLLPVPVVAAWLLGAAVSPTDPVLAASIVAGDPAERDLPARLRILISVESAANDGLAFALVLVGVELARGMGVAAGVADAIVRLVIAVVLGAALGWGAGWLVTAADRHREIEHAAFLALTVSLAILVLGAVELAGGEGLLGVFVAALAYNRETTRAERAEEWEVQEAVNRVLVLPVFVLLGVTLPWTGWLLLGWPGLVFAAGVLAVRRLPLLAVLRRPLQLSWRDAVFAGWFGPVGVAALFYLADAGEQGAATETLWAAGSLAIAVSVVVHGVTATPGRQLYAARARREGDAARSP